MNNGHPCRGGISPAERGTMKRVTFGMVWPIVKKEDVDLAWSELDGAEYIANMADDFSAYDREIAEIERQRRQIVRDARAKGFIPAE